MEITTFGNVEIVQDGSNSSSNDKIILDGIVEFGKKEAWKDLNAVHKNVEFLIVTNERSVKNGRQLVLGKMNLKSVCSF